jgi:hypothetical protein
MSRPVVVGLLTENTPRLLTQAIRLVRSIRWFGGELAGARIVVCGVGTLESGARRSLEELGAEIHSVSRFHPANPTGNRHQLVAELLDAPEEILFLLDCDTIVVRDPLPYLTAGAFQGKIAPTPTVSDEVFERLFAHFGIRKPPRSCIAPWNGEPMIPYFNAGVLALPRALARTLAPSWRKFNEVLADRPELVAPCQRHMHQASLALALAETGVPYAELPEAMNLQINTQHLTPPPGFAETDPVIIHYHHLATDDGFLLPCSYPGAQARIELFHERMRAEGFVQDQVTPAVRAQDSSPVVVLGMHRSGTSVVAQLVHELGVYAGRPDELMPADMFNPTGFWEHSEAVRIDTEILDTLGANRTALANADVSRLSAEQRAGYVARARGVVQSLEGRGPFLLKDPRMALLFPLWRDVLGNPVCVIAWRHPLAVARSLKTRDRQPLLASLAIWEHHNRTLLRDTAGLPRVLVSYEDLLAEPRRVVRELHAALSRLGIESLTVPSDDRLEQIVQPDFNRSGRATPDETLLDSDQRALLDDLRSGAALRNPIAPASVRAHELLAEFGEADALTKALREQVADHDELLRAVFESRSWRLGHGLSSLLRILRRGQAVSAVDRWRELKSRRPL